jgi:mediator of RNA polymerase II transcription subunit 8
LADEAVAVGTTGQGAIAYSISARMLGKHSKVSKHVTHTFERPLPQLSHTLAGRVRKGLHQQSTNTSTNIWDSNSITHGQRQTQTTNNQQPTTNNNPDIPSPARNIHLSLLRACHRTHPTKEIMAQVALSQEDLKALEQTRQRLSQLVNNISSLKTEVLQQAPLPQWFVVAGFARSLVSLCTFANDSNIQDLHSDLRCHPCEQHTIPYQPPVQAF